MTTTQRSADADIDRDIWLGVVREIVGNILYRPESYRFRVEIDAADPAGRVFVQIEHDRPDAYTGVMATGRGGKAYTSPHMTPSEVVRLCLGLALRYEEHEVRESFEWSPGNGKPHRKLFGPHTDVTALWSVANDLDVRVD